MLIKELPARVKALDGDGDQPGTFEAIVAAYNVDSMGDKIVPGAFAKTLESWGTKDGNIPVIWSHQHADPFAHIGYTTDAKETDDGLYIKGVLDVDENPQAKQVYKLIKGGRVANYSFAYDIKDSEAVKSDQKADNDGADLLLKELDLIEVGPCLVGANRDTRTLAVKSQQKKPNEKAVAGSYEQRQQAICDALDGVYTSDDVWAYPIGTFSDSVVYRVSGGTDAGQYQAPYTVNDDGTISIGDATKVTMVEDIVPVGEEKTSDKAADKAGRSLSAANATAIRGALQSIQDALEKLEAVTGVEDSDDAASASDDGKTQTVEPATEDDDQADKGNTDDPEGKSDEPTPTVPVESYDAELQLLGLAN